MRKLDRNPATETQKHKTTCSTVDFSCVCVCLCFTGRLKLTVLSEDRLQMKWKEADGLVQGYKVRVRPISGKICPRGLQTSGWAMHPWAEMTGLRGEYLLNGNLLATDLSLHLVLVHQLLNDSQLQLSPSRSVSHGRRSVGHLWNVYDPAEGITD